MKAILTALTVLSFLLAGCEKAEHNHNADHAGHDHGPNGHNHDQDHAAPADDVAANAADGASAAVAKNYAVECGCAIDSIKKCGNYAVVDGKHVQMTGLDIGPMPFCQKTGLHADIVGKVVDNKLVVSKYELTK